MPQISPNDPVLSDLAHFGDGVLAYIKPISVADAKAIIGDVDGMPGNIELFCLFGADGTPLAISDSREMAFENAMEHDLKPILLH